MQTNGTLKSALQITFKYFTIISVIYPKVKVNYMNNKNALTFMKVEDGIKVDWAHIIFNNLCSELDGWAKMHEKMHT
jgi:hypothetical protein